MIIAIKCIKNNALFSSTIIFLPLNVSIIFNCNEYKKMATIKGRDCMDLTEEDIKRWQEYTEELYKNCLNDPDNHPGVIT